MNANVLTALQEAKVRKFVKINIKVVVEPTVKVLKSYLKKTLPRR